MKKVAFAIVAVTTMMMTTGCCIPGIPCCWAGVLVDLIALLGLVPPAA